ncbi:uncharacterized protein LOC130741148 [Lotus japonicus]|uniref:uncharacterized protein LOC130741148 n=1 Tax=Lotus japonicus TaxID=34305 RepID=UPI002584E3C8|nr:uncharacterized protein LOC130741148 [Lotus japonicus]
MASSTNSVFSYTTSQIPVFNGEHYDYWSSQMETIFLSQDLWDVVEEKYEERPDPKTADWTDVKEKEYKENVKKNATTLRIIQQGVNKAIYPRMFGIKKAKEAWETLKTEFQGSTKVIAIKLQYLWSEFENLTMKEGEKVKEFFSKVAEKTNQIKSCGDDVSEKKLVEKILRSLPKKFEHIVAVIEETKDLSKLTQYELMGSLEAHEQRVNEYNNQPSEQVFQAKQNFKNSKSQQGGQYRGQPSSRGRGGRQFESSDRGRGRRDSSWQQRPSEDETYKLFLSVTDDIKSGEKWYLDSGCSNHVTGNQNAFEVLDKNFSSVVELGDGKEVKIQGKGVIAIHTSEGNKKVIDDIFDKISGTQVVVVMQTLNNLFPLNMNSLQYAAFKTESPNDSYLWHLRYGHLNVKGLQLLKPKNMVVGLPEIQKNDKKSEAFTMFLHFKAFAEKQSGYEIKTLRTDHGGEFIHKSFLNYCKEQGIQRQLTIRYTPQQNGVAERKNRTIVEMARSMLKGKELPNKLWAEAVSSAAYILNRSPTKAVQNKTPFEAWHGRKSIVSQLKVFGCIAYSLIPSQKREKFDEKSEKLNFIGYSDDSKAWKWEDGDAHHGFVELAPLAPLEQSPQDVASPSRSDTDEDDSDPETPPRKFRSLSEIYESCDMWFFASEPQFFDEAVKEDVWRKAMNNEMRSIEKNQTWQLVDLPKGKDSIGLKWVYKTKYNEDGSVQKYKARLVAKGSNGVASFST